MLVIVCELFAEKLDVELAVGVPSGQTGVESECQTVDGLVGYTQTQHPRAGHLGFEIGLVEQVEAFAEEVL